MLDSVIKFVLSNFPLEFLVLGLVAACISLGRHAKPLSREPIWNALLAYYCLFSVGFYFLYNFAVHVFFGETAARFIGWADSPFQLEVGMASLGFGVVGLLAFRRDYGLRLAAIVGPAMFLWGAAVGHVYQIVAHDNFAAGNAGLMLWMDVLLPLVGLAMLFGWQRARGGHGWLPSESRAAAGSC